MYTVYKNFQLKKEEGFVRISADASTELEKLEDERIMCRNFPKCLQNIVEKKLPLDKFDIYNIYTLKIVDYNSITDHKKIWKLGGFDAVGLYDNHYDIDNGRIYFGISKGFLECKSSYWIENVSVYIPTGSFLAKEDTFELFAKNHFDLSLDRAKNHAVLSSLQKTLQKAIIVYQSINDTSVDIYGHGIEQVFDKEVLPLSEVIEK